MKRHLATALAAALFLVATDRLSAEEPPPVAEPRTSAPEQKPAEPPAKPKDEEAPPRPREEAAPKAPEPAPKPPEKAETPSKPEDAGPKPSAPKAAEPKAPPAPKAREASQPSRPDSPAKDGKRDPRQTGSTTRPGDETAAPKRTKAAAPTDDSTGKSQPQRRTNSRTPPVDTERPAVMVVCDETRNDNGLRFIIHVPGPTGVRLSLSDKGGKEIERDLIASSANIAHARIVWGLRNYPAERMLRGTFLITAGDRNRGLTGVMLGYDGAGSLLSFSASLTRNEEDSRRWALNLGQERRFACREPRGEAETTAAPQPGSGRSETRDGGADEERPRRRPREARDPSQGTTP